MKECTESTKHLNEIRKSVRIAENEYKTLLANVIHVNNDHNPRCPLSSFYPPILSGIFPFVEETVVRVSIGSHRLPLTDNKLSLLHDSTLIDICVPPQYILLFYHEGFIHGGGPSTKSCARMFTLFGPTRRRASLQNQNYSGNITECGLSCFLCKVLHSKRKATGIVHLNENKDETVDTSSEQTFNLWDDGFCLLKVAEDEQFKNFPTLSLSNFINNHNFNSLNQEIRDNEADGRRCMLKKGSELTYDRFFEKNLPQDILNYLNNCYRCVISYLEKTTYASYEMKGQTMLVNKGKLGYQRLHMDDKSKCCCNKFKTDKSF